MEKEDIKDFSTIKVQVETIEYKIVTEINENMRDHQIMTHLIIIKDMYKKDLH